ncbi:MAG: hypothetical protein GWP59_00360 [Chlamydiales bacterium]|nr:hypothetical protein [Chlamydiales bacterium]
MHMHTRGYQILNELLEQSKCSKETLVKYFPKEVLENLQNAPKLPLSHLISPERQQFHLLHYSWLVPFVRTLDKALLNIFLSLLSTEQLEGVQKLQKNKLTVNTIDKWAQPFFVSRFLSFLVEDHVLPLNQLPSSDFTPLLDLSKPRYLKFIDYLGLHSLVKEIHTVVDKKTIHKIYQALSKNQVRYLQSLVKQGVEKESSSRFFKLHKWDRNPKSLRMLIHKFGLHRFALSIRDENPSVLWYLTHKLDTGRGKLLNKLLKQEKKVFLSSKDQMQIKHLISLFTKQRKPKDSSQ